MLTNYDVHDTLALMKALEHGRRIDAIKILRTLTGLGLKEAKDQVEATVNSIGAHESKPLAGYDKTGRFVVVQVCDGIHNSYSDARRAAMDRVGVENDVFLAQIVTEFHCNIVEQQVA